MSTLTDILLKESSDERMLRIYIGRNLTPKCFLLNNKIYFDILLSYFPKNGWVLQEQYLQSESQWCATRSIVSRVEKKPSKLMGFDVPTTQTIHFEEKRNLKIGKYTGQYFDIAVQSYEPKRIPYRMTPLTGDVSQEESWCHELSENIDTIYSTCIEEVSVFRKPTCPVQVLMNVTKTNRGSEEEIKENDFSVSLLVEESLQDYKEEVDDLVQVLELAMTRYKKMDRGGFASFKQIV